MKKKLKKLGITLIYRKFTKDEKGYGYFDERNGEIHIDTKQSKLQQDVILIHEFLHAAASGLKHHGVIKKLPSHDFITNSSQQLLALFVESGKWNGIKRSQIKVESE